MLEKKTITRTPRKPEEVTSSYFGGFEAHPYRKDTLKYMMGDCGHFALAFHSINPESQIWLLGIAHFITETSDGSFWDIRGKMSLDQVWNGIDGAEMTPLTRDDVISKLDTGLYKGGIYYPESERQAKRLINTLYTPPNAALKTNRKIKP